MPDYITHGTPVYYYPGMFRIFPKNWKLNVALNEARYRQYKTSLPGDIVVALKRDIFFLSTKTTIDVDKNVDAHGVPAHINIVAHMQDIKNGTVEHITELMTEAGYYLAYRNMTNNNRYWWQFEPYHYSQIRERLEPVIFHVTKLTNKTSIKRNGLIASCKNPIFEYPPRNYFFNAPDQRAFIAYASVNNKGDDNGGFLVCHVDTSMLDDIAFYAVPNYDDRPAISLMMIYHQKL